MPTCKDCIHYDLCADFNLTARADYKRSMQIIVDDGKPERCGFFKDRSKFIEETTAHWVEHKTDIEKMREPQMREIQALGLGKAMGQKYVYWTCSNCGGLGNLSRKYCVNCRAEIKEAEQALKECEGQ